MTRAQKRRARIINQFYARLDRIANIIHFNTETQFVSRDRTKVIALEILRGFK